MKRVQRKRNRNREYILASVLAVLVALMFTLSQLPTYAAEDDLSNIPESGVKYTLTYPDGTAVTTNEDGDPLTYQDVEEALKEENWLLLLSDLKSDAEGRVELPAEWDINGTIKIVETKVPEGYTEGDVKEQTVLLEEGTAIFVNPKDPDPVNPDPEKPDPDKPEPENPEPENPDPDPQPDPVTPDPQPDPVTPSPISPAPVEKFTITYKLNGGTFNGSSEDITEAHESGATIRIHEAPVREGYSFDYWEGSKYQPGDEYKVVENHTFTAQWKENATTNPSPSKSDAVKTGDASGIAIAFLVLLISALVILMLFGTRPVKAGYGNDRAGKLLPRTMNSTALRKLAHLAIIIGLILIIVIAAIGFASTTFAAEGFVINKVDDNGDPVEGAIFDIYGKPEVSWEEITPPTGNVEIRIQKVWDDGDNQDGIRPNEVKVNITADGENLTQAVVKNSDDWYYTLGDLPRYDSTGNEIAYRWAEESVNGYTVASYDANTHYDGNDKFIEITITNAHTPATVTVSGTKTWTSSTGNNDDLDTSKIPEKYTVKLEKSTDGTNWTTVSRQEVSSYMAPPPAPTDPIMPTDEWTFSDLPEKESGVDIQYRVVEETVPDGFIMTGGTKDASGKYNLTNTYTPTTSSVRINVGLTYRIFSGASWSDIVANPQKVTVSGGSMTDKELSFTPGTAAQEVELPGAGTYTISMTGITQSDLQQEDVLDDKSAYMPILIDTVSVTVTVDESGNCTVSGSPTYETFVFGMNQGETFIYNDIEALKEAYFGADDALNKRNPHSDDAGAVATGKTVTLTTVISQVWNPDTGVQDI